MKKVGITGAFAFNTQETNGQIVKTIEVDKALTQAISGEQIARVDTYNWKRNPFGVLLRCIRLVIESMNIVLLPAQNGVKFFVPFFLSANFLFRRKLHYVVIGGWLPDLAASDPKLMKRLKRLDAIYVETTPMMKRLTALGFDNILFMPNFKHLYLNKPNELNYDADFPLKLCFMSRVSPVKGIIELVNAICQLNINDILYTLDIYGPIDAQFTDEFRKLESGFPPFIRYMGVVPHAETSRIMKNYFMHVFPTKYDGEGHPGSILDSFFSGVPVLASEWTSWSDLIENGENGITFPFGDYNEMGKRLSEIANDPSVVINMKSKCLESASELTPERVIKVLAENLA